MIALLGATPGTLGLASPSPSGAPQTRNLHSILYCVDVTPAQNFQVGEEVTNNNDATASACNAYKGRNTGTAQWDTCRDCTVLSSLYSSYFSVQILMTLWGDNGGSGSGLVVECKSAGKHLGGDEFTVYCKSAGATRGAA